MEQIRAVASVRASEESEGIQRENEELKEVLSAVQLDLEAKTEVGSLMHPHGKVAPVEESLTAEDLDCV